jgi:hypothetical protein
MRGQRDGETVMRAEISVTMGGKMSIEIIAETKFERGILSAAWQQRGYDRGNGQSRFDDGATGFYVPLFDVGNLPEPRK